MVRKFKDSEWGGSWGRDYDLWLFEALELEIVWTRSRDEPDGKSGEVLQTGVQTISSQAKAGYSNSQQKGTLTASKKVHLGQRPKNDGTSKRWFDGVSET